MTEAEMRRATAVALLQAPDDSTRQTLLWALGAERRERDAIDREVCRPKYLFYDCAAVFGPIYLALGLFWLAIFLWR